MRHFALDLHASDAAQLSGISHRSVIMIFGKIRQRLAEECERQSPFKSGEVEVDESYFGPARVRGKRGRGAGRKTMVVIYLTPICQSHSSILQLFWMMSCDKSSTLRQVGHHHFKVA